MMPKREEIKTLVLKYREITAGSLIIIVIFFFISLSHHDICAKISPIDKASFKCSLVQTRQCTDSEELVPRPRPLVIIAAGGHASASTFLFNALRILMRIRDPNTISGWHLDLEHYYQTYGKVMQRNYENNKTNTNPNVNQIMQYGNRMQAMKSLGSVLIKLHQVQEWHDFVGYPQGYAQMEDIVDGVFTSHRDIRHIVRFDRDMGWGTFHTDEQMSHPDFCRRKRKRNGPGGKLIDIDKPRFLKEADYEDEKNWVQIARGHLKCRQVLLDTAGKALKMDMKAEDVKDLSIENTVRFLKKLGSYLDYIYTHNDLQSAARELRMLKPVKCDSGYAVEMDVHPITHYHKGHWHSGEDEVMKKGMQAIADDEGCKRWLQAHKYI